MPAPGARAPPDRRAVILARVKHVYLLRHAKSSWDDPTLADHDRPLAPRGKRAAAKLARHLEREPIRPALVLCSSARRARQTLKRLQPALGEGVDVVAEPGLYGADADALLARLRALPDAVPSVLVVGHNPGLEQLALLLAREGADLARLRERFPTGALAAIAVRRLSWSDLRPGDGELTGLVLPRELD